MRLARGTEDHVADVQTDQVRDPESGLQGDKQQVPVAPPYTAEHLRLRVDSQHRALDLPASAIELRRKAFDDRRDGNARAGVNGSAGEHNAVRREADLTTGSEFGEQRARDGRERARPIGAKPDENWLCRMNGHEDLRQSWVMRLRKAAARALAQGPRPADTGTGRPRTHE